jgi:hypothetical protein
MSAEIPHQEPKPRPPRKRAAKPVSKYDILDSRGFLGGSKELDKAHINALGAVACGCDNHETQGLTILFRAGITDPKTIFRTYDKYADIEDRAHQKYIEDGFRHVYQQAEEICIFEAKKGLDT